jgi:hypothetical protein
MDYNFLPCNRNQSYLPPPLTDWLPEGHLAWFALDAVEQLDLEPFYEKFCPIGWQNTIPYKKLTKAVWEKENWAICPR